MTGIQGTHKEPQLFEEVMIGITKAMRVAEGWSASGESRNWLITCHVPQPPKGTSLKNFPVSANLSAKPDFQPRYPSHVEETLNLPLKCKVIYPPILIQRQRLRWRPLFSGNSLGNSQPLNQSARRDKRSQSQFQQFFQEISELSLIRRSLRGLKCH